MPLADRIIAEHAGRSSVVPGEIHEVDIDRLYIQDGNSPTIARIFGEQGFDRVFDAERIGVFFDHSVLPPNISMADRIQEAERFCESFGFRRFAPGAGISHLVALEQGWFEPGTIVLGSDSHTCTGGVRQCLALGMGATDIAAAMVTGRTWLLVPESVCLEIRGAPAPSSGPKDLLLALLAKYPSDQFLYRSIEWTGDWIGGLSRDGAATLANMAVEMGAKCAFLPPHRGAEELEPIRAGGEGYVEHLVFDAEGLPPHVARPHSPSSSVPIDECSGLRVDQVFVGSCTNGKFEDIQQVSAILKGRQIHPRTTLVVTPASRDIFLRCLEEGYVETIMRAGGLFTPAGCGSCLGTQGPIPATGSRVLTTMNRNFQGRMGNRDAEIFLSSPTVAAWTAIKGEIPKLEDLS